MDQKFVLTMGDVAVDWVVPVERYPIRGGQAISSSGGPQAGGSIGNTTVGLARLGIPAAFLGKLGNDINGKFLLEDLQKEGVDTRYTPIDPATYTPTIICVVDNEGERTFFACAKGSSAFQIRPDEISREAIFQSCWVHCSGVLLLEEPSRSALLEVLRLCQEAGVPSSFDPNLRADGSVLPEDSLEIYRLAIKLAETTLTSVGEINMLYPGISVDQAIKEIVRQQKTIVVRSGSQGATGVTAHQNERAPAFHSIEVVNTLGAGDAFNAGYIYGRLKGYTLFEALQYGNAVAALKMSAREGRGLPTIEQVNRFIADRV